MPAPQSLTRKQLDRLLCGPHLDRLGFLRLLGGATNGVRSNWVATWRRFGAEALVAARRHLDLRTYADLALTGLPKSGWLPLLRKLAQRQVAPVTNWPIVWMVLERWLTLRDLDRREVVANLSAFMKAWGRVAIFRHQILGWAEQALENLAMTTTSQGRPFPDARRPLQSRLWWLGQPIRRDLIMRTLGQVTLSWPVDATEEISAVRNGLAVGYPHGFTLVLDFSHESVQGGQCGGTTRTHGRNQEQG